MSVARISANGISAGEEQGTGPIPPSAQATAAIGAGVRTIATGDLRDEVLSADGHSVLVSDAAGTVTRYDLATGASTGSWQVGTSLGGMAVSSDGHYLYATELTPGASEGGYPQTNTAEIDRLDLQSGTVTRYDIPLTDYAPLSFRDVAVESSGNVLVTSAGGSSGFSALYDVNLSANSATVVSTSYYGGLDYGVLQGTSDGNHVAITESGSASISLRNVADRTMTSGYDYNSSAGGATAISADGSMIARAGTEFDVAASVTRQTVFIHNPSLQVETDLVQVAAQAIGNRPVAGLAFSADGAHLFVLNTSLDAVVELSTSSWVTEAVIPVDKTPVGPVFVTVPGVGPDLSPFGDRLLASADGHWLTVQTDGEVQVIDLMQTSPTPVLTLLSLPTDLTVGPNGGNLFITAGATDATSTVQSVTITLDHAIATANGPVTQITFSADHDAFDDTYSAVNLALTGAAGGTYTVTAATVTDAEGHSVSYSEAALDALLPERTFTVTAEQNLTADDDTYHDTFGQGLIVHGLDGNDTLYGSATTDTLDGGTGNDTLVQGLGATTFIGGDGVDTVVLNGNARDYYEVHPIDGNEIVLFGRNGSAAQTITEDVEHVRFADGTEFTSDNRPASDYSALGTVTGDYTINAPAGGYYTFNGGSGDNEVFLPGIVSDYTLSRGEFEEQGPYYSYHGGAPGNFNLTSKDGATVYSFDESIDAIHFANGQYLALKDLPAYVSGDASVAAGGAQNDILFQTKISGYEGFIGGAGHDDLYLNGNVSDYTVRDVYAVMEGAGYVSGIELIGDNGSGALFIDDTVNTVHFQNGQYLAFGDVASYVAPAAPATSDTVFHLLSDGVRFAGVDGSAYANDVALLDGNASDYSLQRDNGSGDFRLIRYDPVTGNPAGEVALAESVQTVQFGNGQYLALKDLPAYLTGNATFTNGTDGDDLLFVGSVGDQYVYGGTGQDDLYIHGNVQDYTLQQVTSMHDWQHGGTITGVELVADNGSGNIYIDHSVETVHFQNGQYLAYQDLGAFIH